MYRNGRPVEPVFESSEAIYLRFGAGDFLGETLEPGVIRFPQSTNRGRFSEPEDVLFHEEGKYNGLGVVEFSAGSLPKTVTGDQDSRFDFFLVHDPLEDNYAHSEIRSDRSPSEGGFRPPSRSVKLNFRIEFSLRITRTNIRIPAVKSRG